MQSQLERIKEGLSIELAWSLLGLRGTPKKDCKSPFREEKRASFSIYTTGKWQRWFDHGSGEGGDVVDLWAKATQQSVKDAIADIVRCIPSLGSEMPPETPTKPPEPSKASGGIKWPPGLKSPSEADCRALASLRGLNAGAFDLAGRLGTLKVGRFRGQYSWILTDPSGLVGECRRFDGELYRVRSNDLRKSDTLAGSKKNWPVGLKTARPEFDASGEILLVEGMPDYFAALHLAIDSLINFRPVAMLGAGCSIGPEAKQYFRKKTVLIIPHSDAKGENSVRSWTEQLDVARAQKIIVQRLPAEYKDLNDFVVHSPSVAQTLVLKGFNAPVQDART